MNVGGNGFFITRNARNAITKFTMVVVFVSVLLSLSLSLSRSGIEPDGRSSTSLKGAAARLMEMPFISMSGNAGNKELF